MQRFVLRENIRRYAEFLASEPDPDRRETVLRLLALARRDLSLLDAGTRGLFSRSGRGTAIAGASQPVVEHCRTVTCGSAMPRLLIDPAPGLRILVANPAFSATTLMAACSTEGRNLFEVLTDNTEDPHADGVVSVFAALLAAATEGMAQALERQRYDMTDAGGHWAARHWKMTVVPHFSCAGDLACLTLQMEPSPAQPAEPGAGDDVPLGGKSPLQGEPRRSSFI